MRGGYLTVTLLPTALQCIGGSALWHCLQYGHIAGRGHAMLSPLIGMALVNAWHARMGRSAMMHNHASHGGAPNLRRPLPQRSFLDAPRHPGPRLLANIPLLRDASKEEIERMAAGTRRQYAQNRRGALFPAGDACEGFWIVSMAR